LHEDKEGKKLLKNSIGITCYWNFTILCLWGDWNRYGNDTYKCFYSL